MNLVEYFNEIKVLDDKAVKKAYDIFGKDALIEFLNSIKNNSLDNQVLIQKINDYLNCASLVNEIKNVHDEMHKLASESRDESLNSLTVTGAYFKEISKYPLLSLEEEMKYCEDLKLKEKITILKHQYINGQRMHILDLEKIFISLVDNQYASLILNSLKAFHYPKESGYHRIINYYLEMYDVLFDELGHCPNYEELKTYFSKIDKYKLLTFSNNEKLDKITLLEEVKNYLKYSHAKEMMINCNLRMVVSIAKKYDTDIELIDLINEGNLGLMQAISRFDVSLGYHFSTYAFYWIRQHISRYIYNHSTSVKITENFKYRLACFRKKIYNLEQEYKRTLSILEISKHLNMSVEKVINLMAFSYTMLSLDEVAIRDEGDITFGNLLFDKDADVEEISDQNCLKRNVEKMLSELKPRERLVIELRYGIGEKNASPRTLQEIGDILGVTRERARQIEKRAITKLKSLATTSSFSHLSEY